MAGSSIKCIPLKKLEKSDNKSSQVQVRRDNDFLRKILNEGMIKKSDNHLINFFSPWTSPETMSMHHLALQYSGDRTNYLDFLEFCRDNMSEKSCLEVEEITKNQSQCSSWYEFRYGRITASQVYQAAHCHTFDGSLVAQLLGGKIPENEAMKRGRMLEKKVIDKAASIFQLKIRSSGLLLSPLHPQFGASPDGVSDDYVIEIKCPSKLETIKNYYDGGSITPKCKAQIQLQMKFAKKTQGLFCMAHPNFEENEVLLWHFEHYDAEYVDNLLQRAGEFWSKAVYPVLMKNKC